MLTAPTLERIKADLYLNAHRRCNLATDRAIRLLQTEYADVIPNGLTAWIDPLVVENNARGYETRSGEVEVLLHFEPDCIQEIRISLELSPDSMLDWILTTMRCRFDEIRAAIVRDREAGERALEAERAGDGRALPHRAVQAADDAIDDHQADRWADDGGPAAERYHPGHGHRAKPQGHRPRPHVRP